MCSREVTTLQGLGTTSASEESLTDDHRLLKVISQGSFAEVKAAGPAHSHWDQDGCGGHPNRAAGLLQPPGSVLQGPYDEGP
uniref:Uncharacterized protein n=1 Tax=Homo sapiens TaxID=9606 RepID=Q8TCW6_HUMAN|nr:unknown [Homo sapiens]